MIRERNFRRYAEKRREAFQKIREGKEDLEVFVRRARGSALFNAIPLGALEDLVKAIEEYQELKSKAYAAAYGNQEALAEFLDCPKCGGPMHKEVNSSTSFPFYGCDAFPKCNGSRDWDNPKKDRGHLINEPRPYRGPI